jgi:hypothetical protein
MTETERLAAAIKKISEKYLTAVVKNKDEKGITKWALRLADYSTRLAILVTPEVRLASREAAEVEPAEAPPNFGDSDRMSSGLYNDWVVEWVQRRFPEAYVNWPPEVKAISPDRIAAAAKEDGCLAQVCAAGVLGFPGGPWDELGDWSLYTALTGTSEDGGFVYKVFHMGKLVGQTQSASPDDGLAFAALLGFNW